MAGKALYSTPMASPDWKNALYFGDNLGILRDHIPDESVDLIYLDPPFNSNASYNVLFREKSGEESAARITALRAACTTPLATFRRAPRRRRSQGSQGDLV